MYATQVYTEDGETIATLHWYQMPKIKAIREGKDVLVTSTYRDSNAQLISKAPELYEMIDLLIKQLDNYSQVYGYNEAELISKANKLYEDCTIEDKR